MALAFNVCAAWIMSAFMCDPTGTLPLACIEELGSRVSCCPTGRSAGSQAVSHGFLRHAAANMSGPAAARSGPPDKSCLKNCRKPATPLPGWIGRKLQRLWIGHCDVAL